jgi:hypothetical protein
MPHPPARPTHARPHTCTCALPRGAAQVSLLRAGRGAEVVQETRLWDEFKLVTYSMRKKEGLADYRCGDVLWSVRPERRIALLPACLLQPLMRPMDAVRCASTL